MSPRKRSSAKRSSFYFESPSHEKKIYKEELKAQKQKKEILPLIEEISSTIFKLKQVKMPFLPTNTQNLIKIDKTQNRIIDGQPNRNARKSEKQKEERNWKYSKEPKPTKRENILFTFTGWKTRVKTINSEYKGTEKTIEIKSLPKETKIVSRQIIPQKIKIKASSIQKNKNNLFQGFQNSKSIKKERSRGHTGLEMRKKNMTVNECWAERKKTFIYYEQKQ